MTLQGRFAVAEPLARQVLATLEQVSGPTYASTGLAMSRLAGIYQARGRYLDAEDEGALIASAPSCVTPA